MSDVTARMESALAGRYKVIRRLGEGGMATVYLADDVKHDRKVALKVLKPELAAVIGAERFLTEIRTTANLQHPHILPLFDSGEADKLLYYVMPFVEGESLRERIDREKQLPVDEAVSITVAVASALDYAHRQGIIHRDIKPANILLQDGQPVVADFGIALAIQNAASGRMTETGLSLGTPHYMSPEQATADRDLSAQSDVYALACVAYELLTGGPPFSAPTAQAVLMQILTEDARPVTRVRKSVPPHVEAAIARGLEKLPADRFSSAGAFSDALKNPGSYVAPAAAGVSGGPGLIGPVWLWPGLVAVLLIAAVWGWGRSSQAPQRGLVAFSAVQEGVDALQAGGTALAISPDGSAVAYVGLADDGALSAFIRNLGSPAPRNMGGSQVTAVLFSGDGRSLITQQGSLVMETPLAGGASRTIASDGFPLSGLSRGNDGSIFYLNENRGISRYLDGEVSTFLDAGLGFVVDLLGDGERALVTTALSAGVLSQVAILNLETGDQTNITTGQAIALRDGIVVWLDPDGGILASRIDERRGELVGSPVTLLGGVGGSVVLSQSGDLAFTGQGSAAPDMIRVDRQGARSTTGIPIGGELGVRASPDGRAVTFVAGFNLGEPDVFTVDLETGVRTRLTFDGGIYPQFSPDGNRVAYYRQVDGDYALYVRNSDASGEESVLLDTETATVEVAFVPGTNRIVVREGDQARLDGSDIYMYEMGDPESRVLIAGGPGNQLSPVVSPNGRFVAYSTDDSGGGTVVLVRSLENPNERWDISAGAGSEPMWSADGTELFYRSGTEFLAVPVETEAGTFRTTGPGVVLFSTAGLTQNRNRTSYDVTPDGQSFLFGSASSLSVEVVLNWWDEVKRLLGEN